VINSPKISIVTVSYNQAEYLEHTINSVLSQNYPNLEYIIIDGGSDDGSLDIIKKYEKYFSYWISEKDSGMYDAIQKGFENSTGEIMAWINSDDYYHPGSFNVVSEIFSSFPEVEWLQGIPSAIDEKNRTVYVRQFRKWSKFDFYMNDTDHIQQESTFWRRSLWEKVGSKLNTDLKYAGDYELWLRFFDFARLYCTKTILGAFRMRSKNQLSIDKMKDYNSEVKKSLDKRLTKLSEEEIVALNFLGKRNQYSFLNLNLNRHKKQKIKNEILNCPPAIVFNWKKNAFVFE
jgi:glycosyltransferase involved in cell wall biosynthesis